MMPMFVIELPRATGSYVLLGIPDGSSTHRKGDREECHRMRTMALDPPLGDPNVKLILICVGIRVERKRVVICKRRAPNVGIVKRRRLGRRWRPTQRPRAI